MIVGLKLIYKIQKFGNSINLFNFVSLKLDEYCVVLVYAYPHGSVKKARNRTVGFEKASELESVRSALIMYVAAAVAFFRSRGASAPPPDFPRIQI